MLPQVPEPRRPARALHPSVVRAAVSPSAAIVTAAGAGIGVLDHSVVLAVILGGGAWLGRMVVAVVRSRRKRRRPLIAIDPFAVPEPWRQFVRQAQGARQRFDQTISGWTEGPLRDHLVLIQPRLWQATEEVWSVAQRGAALEGTLRGVPTGARPSIVHLSAELRQVQAQRQATPASDRQASLARTEEAIAAQLRAAHRSDEAKAEVLDRLRVLTAQLEEAVTQLLELGLEPRAGAQGEGSAEAVGGSVDALVEEIAALHQGLRAAEAASSGGELPGPEPAPPPALPPSPPAAP